MYRGHTVGVVIPAYNEAGFVGDVVDGVPSLVDRIYPVDDGSTDETWAEIRAAATRVNDRADPGPFDRRVVPIQHPENRGVGGAIKTGYLAARDDDIDVTVVMGGDGQMEVEMLDRLLDPIVEGRADYVKGNRLLGRAGRGDMPRFRFVGNAALAALTKIASGYWESGDPQSGYTAISAQALDRAHVEEMYEFYGYCNDLLVKLNVADCRVADVPRPITYGDEESHIRYRTYVPRVSWMLLRNFGWRLRTKYLAYDFHPLVVVYLLGALGTLGGLVAGAGSLLAGGTGLVSAALLTVVGLLAAVWAMLLDREANAHLDATVSPVDRPAAQEAPDADATAGQVSDGDTERAGQVPGDGTETAMQEGDDGGEETVQEPPTPAPGPRIVGDGIGDAVTVELRPAEWERVLDAVDDGGARPGLAAIRERIRGQVAAPDGGEFPARPVDDDRQPPMDPGERTARSADLDLLFDLLADPYRRAALYVLRDAEGALEREAVVDRTLRTLPDSVASGRWEADTLLRHVHLPKLAEAGAVARDGDAIAYRGSPLLDRWLAAAAHVEVDGRPGPADPWSEPDNQG